MNTNELLKPYIEKFLAGGEKAIEETLKFVETQAPQLTSEIILWGAVSELIAPIIGLALVGFAIWLHKTFSKYGEEGYYNNGYGDPPLVLVTIATSIIGAIMFFVEIMDAVYPLIAPRVFLLEKISQLIK